MKRIGRPALYTIIYYAVVSAIITGIEASGKFKTGPCTPDLDVLAPMLFFLISCILFVVTIVQAIRLRGGYLTALLIHLIIIGSAVIWVYLISKYPILDSQLPLTEVDKLRTYPNTNEL